MGIIFTLHGHICIRGSEAIKSVERFCRLPPHVDSKVLGRAGIREGFQGIGWNKLVAQSVGVKYH